MADRGVWFKLWGISLNDQGLQNLSLENWARWVRLGVYTKVHGKNGKMKFRAPFNALLDLFRCTAITDIEGLLPSFPHVEILWSDVTNGVPLQLEIKFHNWYKYQHDSSLLRVRKHRANVTRNVTVQEEKRREVEENKKRGDTGLPHFVDFWKGKTAQERQAGAAQIAEGLKAFGLGFRQQDDLYKKIIGEDKTNGTIRSKSISQQVAERRPKERPVEPRKEASAGEIFARVRDLPTIQPED